MGFEIDSAEFDALIESGDSEEINRVLEALYANDESDEDDESASSVDEETEQKNKEDVNSEPSRAEPEDQTNTETLQDDYVILTKDGKRAIPFSELQGERKKNAELKASLDRFMAYCADNEIDPDDVLQGRYKAGKGVSDQEKLEHINDLDPSLGEIMAGLYEKLNSREKIIEEMQAQVRSGDVNTLDGAIAANKDLASWQKSGDERWDYAIYIDDKLQNSEQWKTKSMVERFAEVERLTKRAFSNNQNSADVSATAKKRVAEAIDKSIPTSLTEMGRPASDTNKRRSADEMSTAELTAMFSSMSSEKAFEALSELLGN